MRFEKGLNLRCLGVAGGHRHEPGRGRHLKKSEEYTNRLAQRVMQIIRPADTPVPKSAVPNPVPKNAQTGERRNTAARSTKELLPVNASEEPAEEGQPVKDIDKVEDLASLQKAVRRLHANLDHPGNRSLAGAIRLIGGSEASVKIAPKLTAALASDLKRRSRRCQIASATGGGTYRTAPLSTSSSATFRGTVRPS